MIEPVLVVVFLVGASAGCCLGILTVALVRSAAQPLDVFTKSDVMQAYLIGWQDGVDGISADTTHSAVFMDWPAELNEGRNQEPTHG